LEALDLEALMQQIRFEKPPSPPALPVVRRASAAMFNRLGQRVIPHITNMVGHPRCCGTHGMRSSAV
jgi:hypothetical protein